ncbi:hypothetical protein DdX_10583 [Ditylenchus destructor]|uniref:Uncharacterized protein n=1 Tax=Ditylenchus destructor TaxID=166010 RepID=A0AAD4R5B8_9BILA|nr:hypothetical protein DdX_10583 [Ditylenchus destructor]
MFVGETGTNRLVSPRRSDCITQIFVNSNLFPPPQNGTVNAKQTVTRLNGHFIPQHSHKVKVHSKRPQMTKIVIGWSARRRSLSPGLFIVSISGVKKYAYEVSISRHRAQALGLPLKPMHVISTQPLTQRDLCCYI